MKKRTRPWIYIIGPYTGKTVTDQEDNCRFALNAARDIWEHGGAAVCPHYNSHLLDACAPYRDFIAAYKRLLEKCDGAMVLDSRTPSRGSRAEIAHAKRHGIPIYYNDLCEEKTLEQWIAELKLRT